MADHTHIEWTDATWNPITGCSVVSAGCKHCYAMKLAGTRLQHHPSRAGLTIETAAGPVWNGQVRLNEEWLDQPLRWRRPRMIFVCAHGDLFHESVPDEWIDRVFDVMERARARKWLGERRGWGWEDGHTFQVLTKRAARMLAYVQARLAKKREYADAFKKCPTDAMRNSPAARAARDDATAVPPYVWLGVSVENQAAADERIPLLLRTPAVVRWISAEPLLGPVDFYRTSDSMPMEGHPWRGTPILFGIHWVVAGGESGAGARPMHPDWARSLRDQCAAAGVPFLFKQWGNWRPPIEGEDYNTAKGCAQRVPAYIVAPAGTVHCFENGDWTCGGEVMLHVGKKAAGRLLDGVQHDGYPEVRNG